MWSSLYRHPETILPAARTSRGRSHTCEAVSDRRRRAAGDLHRREERRVSGSYLRVWARPHHPCTEGMTWREYSPRAETLRWSLNSRSELLFHREKCAVVLGAAVAVNIALAEADAVSPALDAVTQMQLKRLCSGVLSTLGLAVARVRVYGQFSRIRKIFRLIRYRATESKFEELRSDLETLEAQLWTSRARWADLIGRDRRSGTGRRRHDSQGE